MRFSTSAVLLALSASVSAHFQLLYPPPRGPFVADIETEFCGGYPTAGNRTKFPLSGGFFTIKSSHAGFTVGAILSTDDNPTTFDSFRANGSEQIASPYAKEDGAGTFCIPLNLNATGISGVRDGANVTIQIVFEGGDGALYQCSELSLSADLTTPTDATCSNSTDTTHSHSSNSSTTHEHSDASPTGQSSGFVNRASASALFLGVIGVAAALL